MRTNRFEIMPIDGRKSFYGKATVYTDKNGDYVLTSYTTDVCKVDKNGKFTRLWSGYSATTMRHVNAFLSYFGNGESGKKWWDSQEIKRG